MIHIINRYNQHLYADTLDQMFELRHKVFVEGKGWKKLAQPSGFEIDQFDTDDAIYFLKLDENDKILGGMRLVPTTCPTQLGTIFKNWCDFKKAPEADNVYEWSRYFIVDNTHRSKAGYPVFYELFFAILEYAVAKNIVSLTGFLEAITLPRLNALPWDLEYLGNIVNYGGTNGEPEGKGAAIMVNVDKRMLRITKRLKKMATHYFALPLGDQSPVPHMAFNAETCLKFLEFMEEYPEHSEVMIGFANLFGSPQSVGFDSMSSKASEWLSNQLVEESMHGFAAPISKSSFMRLHSFTEQ